MLYITDLFITDNMKKTNVNMEKCCRQNKRRKLKLSFSN